MKRNRVIARLLVMILLFCVCIPSKGFGAEPKKTIKVGYVDYKGFIEKQEDGSFTGYGVDYLKEIAKYTDLDYDFVYAPWGKSLEMLKNHTLDLVCTAKYTAERDEIYDFSEHSIGIQQGVLYTLPRNDTLYYEDFTGLEGQKIGFLKESLNFVSFADYAKRNGFSFQKVEYDSEKEMADALHSGAVAAIATEHMAYHDDLKLIGRYGSQPYHLMTYEGNPIMEQIDYALGEINSYQVDFQTELFHKYYDKSAAQSQPTLTRKEIEYIKKAPKLRVAMNSGIEPIAFLDKKTGKTIGITPSILDKIAEVSGLQFEYVPLYGVSQKYTYDYFRENKIHLIASIEVNDLNEQLTSLTLTRKYFSALKVLVGRRGETISSTGKHTIAIVGGSGTLQAILKREFPNFSVKVYTSLEDCLDAVKNREADVLLYNQYLVERHLGRPQYEDLVVVPGIQMDENLGISPVVYEQDAGEISTLLSDPRLISILNKSIDVISEKEMEGIIVKYTSAVRRTFSWQDFIYKYRYPSIAVGVLLATLWGMMIFLSINRTKNASLLQKKNRELAEAVVQAEHANKAKGQFLAINLLTNAVKFTPEGGTITITLQVMEEKKNHICSRISIADTGIGMSQGFLERMFQPFEQENNGTTTTYSGTGLGLSIVKNLVDLMGGCISVASQKGVGTTVVVELEHEVVRNPVEKRADGVQQGDAVLLNRRILLVEDHPLNMEIAKKLLEKKGMLVEHAENGQVAVELFLQSEQGYYSGILMDIRMPVMDGLEATRTIRGLQRQDATTIPIIAMTANAFAEDREKSKEAGMNAHLAKPIEPNKLYETLKNWIAIQTREGE